MELSETPPPTNHRLPDPSRNPTSSSLLRPPPPPMQDLRPNPGPDGRILTARHRAPRPQEVQLSLKCPRCDSPDTKFCYYNNYNLSQPRHFCRSCRRYWTRGGVLRNVPVGGGCRRKSSKRPAAATAAATSSPPPPPPPKARKLSPPPSDTWKPEPEEAGSIAAMIGNGFGDPYPEELSLQEEPFSDPMAAAPPGNEWVDLGCGGGGFWTEMDPSLYLL